MSQLTVSELASIYQAYAHRTFRKHGRPTRTANNVRDALRELMQTPLPPPADTQYPSIHALPATAMTVRVLRATQRTMEESGRLNRQTINDRVKTIKRMYRWAVGEGLIEDPRLPETLALLPPLRKLRTPAPEPAKVSAVPEARVQATLTALAEEMACPRTPQHRRLGKLMLSVIIETHWLTGMRPGEVVQMADTSIQRVTLQMPGKPEAWLYRPGEHKVEHYDRDRIVIIGPEAQSVLRPWIRRVKTAGSAWLFEGRDRRGRPTGRPMLESSYYTAIRRLNERHGIPHWHPNQLRHSFAVRMVPKAGYEKTKDLMGHADVQTTQIYARMEQELLADIMRVMHEHG